MNSADQVLFVLELILVLGPLAVYFLSLGLVNSLAHPCLVNARTDFVVLTIAFVPIVAAPLVLLVQSGQYVTSLLVLALFVLLFSVMLPEPRGRWVLYNCSLQQCRRLIEQSARKLGWSAASGEDLVRLSPSGLRLQIAALPWLRNVTLRIVADEGADAAETERLVDMLSRESVREGMLPSPTGASLVVIGAALLGVPMWYVIRHMDAIVDVVKHILFA